jgi:mycothiol synthase
MVDCNPDPQIDGVRPQHRTEVLDLVFGHLPAEDRGRQIAEAHGPWDGLLAAWRGDRLVGAVFSQIEPGRTAALWLPRLAPGEPLPTAAQLFAATWDFLVQEKVALAHAVLPTVNRVERMTLQLGELDYLANLAYLVAPESELPQAPPAVPFTLTPCCPSRRKRWAAVLRATYEGSLDCPGLEDIRNAEDTLTGYRSIGTFAPHLWLTAHHEGRTVGCVILADHPKLQNMELLYMGLVPRVRGRGWGKPLARYAQWLAHRAGRRRVVLAVDADNAPALQTYTAVRFQAWQHRQLFVKRLVHRPLARIASTVFPR